MNGVLGYAMVIAILVAMGSVEDALASTSPISAILLQITGSVNATVTMMTGLFVISFAINLAFIASVSRLTWAWVRVSTKFNVDATNRCQARDGGLSPWLAYVSIPGSCNHPTSDKNRLTRNIVFLYEQSGQ